MTGRKQAALDACEGLAYETLVLSSSGFERELVERVVAHLRRGSRVLEIGCGSGANLRMLDGRGTGVFELWMRPVKGGDWTREIDIASPLSCFRYV